MKKIIFGAVVTMFTLSSFQSTAQIKKGAYASLNVGYNAGAANTNLLENRTSAGSTTTRDVVKFSYGKGITAGLNLGYMVNENIGFELGLGYLLGGKTKSTEQFTFGSTTSTGTQTTSATMIQIKPTVVLATTINKMSPYAKFGVVIGSGSIKNEIEEKSGANIDITKTSTKGGMAIGFNSAIGVAFPINDNLSFLAELNMVNMQYTPKKSTTTLYTENGVDKLGTWTVRDKETDYVKSITTTGTAPNTGVPRQSLSSAYAFGSIGINVGVKYSF